MISPTPSWLPPIAPVSGDLGLVVRSLFSIFELDFVVARPHLGQMDIWWDRNSALFEGVRCCQGYKHLITREDDNTYIRQFDPPRAERMPWCKPMLTNCCDATVKMWRRLEPPKRTMIYVWLEHQDYVAVLEERRQHIGAVAFLITAYHVDGDSMRRSLQRKWEGRLP
jgi:hypothetical protein